MVFEFRQFSDATVTQWRAHTLQNEQNFLLGGHFNLRLVRWLQWATHGICAYGIR